MTRQPEALKDYTPQSRTGPKPTYPWKDWLDLPPKGKRTIPKKGLWKRLTADVHFDCSRDSMADMLRRNARRMGYAITIHKEDDTTLVFRRMGRLSAKPKPKKKAKRK